MKKGLGARWFVSFDSGKRDSFGRNGLRIPRQLRE
jgi:hypothetical protein